MISKDLFEIPKEAFRDDRNLQSLTFSAGSQLHIIRSNAFSGCSSLTSLELPDPLVDIKSRAFYRCKNLKTVHFPKNLRQIGIEAFYFCEIESLELPDTLELLEESVSLNATI